MRKLRKVLGVGAAGACGAVVAAGLAAGPGAHAAPQTLRPAAGIRMINPMVVTHRVHSPSPPTEAQCIADYSVPCYGPTQLETAYNEQPLFAQGINGSGETIVIVDSFGAPTIVSNLGTFDRAYGLPAPPSLRILQPVGKVTFKATTTTMVGWAGEATLDVEYSHAMAPGANIILVETPTAESLGPTGFPTIVAAENYVIDHHLGDVISQSFGAAEETFPDAQSLLALRSDYLNAALHGVTVLAAAGDTGASTTTRTGGHFTYPVVGWPASDPLVTAVGGTELNLNQTGQRLAPDRVWNDTYNSVVTRSTAPIPLATGGGVSSIFPRPWYQNGVAGVVGNRRGIPDISMSGSCSGPVLTYETIDGKTAAWTLVCGTSEASPLFAGIVALADQAAHHPLGLINPALYAMSAQKTPGLVDIAHGNNTVSFVQTHHHYTVHGFKAGPGFDLASGVGTVNAALFVPELVQTADRYGTAIPTTATTANLP
jgi:subtilase family serine protease